ncbi:MAG: hypothetical protein WDA47_08535 [Bacilli bacterium]
MAKIIEKYIGMEEIISETGGRYPLYVKITNGNDIGADDDYPGLYRFDYASPQISQIMQSIGDAKTSNPDNKGVGRFIGLVLESRNIKSGQKNASVSVPGNPSQVLLKLPDGTEYKKGVANFDRSVCHILKALNIVYATFNGSIEITDKTLQPMHGECLPLSISNDLAIISGAKLLNISTTEILGSFYVSDTLLNWKPKKIGSDKSKCQFIFANLGKIPDLSGTAVTGLLSIWACSNLDFAFLPKSINGTLNLAGNHLTKLGNLPDVTNDMILAGNSDIDLLSCPNLPKIGGDLIISEDYFKQNEIEYKGKKVTDPEAILDILAQKFRVSGEIRGVTNKEALRISKVAADRYVVGVTKPELGDWASIGMAFTEKHFGTLGTSAVKSIYKMLTGRKMATPKSRRKAIANITGSDDKY